MLRQILFLSSTCLTVYHHSGRRLERIGCFVGADAGLAHFDDYLQKFAALPALVLTDLVEEDFRIDTVAHTLGGDRKALLDRHVTRLYRGTDYRYAHVLGRDPKNKRKDEVLFSGLLNSELADMWLEAMRHHKTPIVGVYSLPLVSLRLVNKIWDKRKDVLFVTHNLSSGLRQSFFIQGQMRFSRLTPIPEDIPSQDYARFVHAEIGKTKRYLSNLHLLARDVVLDVCIPSGGEPLAELEKMRSNETLTHYELHDVSELARGIGYRGAINADYCDELFVYSLATHRHPNHYGSEQHRYHFKLHRIHQALTAASVAAVIGGVLWTSAQISDGLLYRGQIAGVEARLSQAQEHYSELQSRTPEASIAADDVRLAVTTADQLQQQRHTPSTVLSQYGQALLRNPGLQVTQIEWFVSTDPQATGIPDEDSTDTNPAEEFDSEGNPIEQSATSGKYQIGILKGVVLPFDGNYARAHQRIEGLMVDLRRVGNVVSVDALDLPLNIATSGQVTGGLGGDNARPDAQFSLRLVLGDGHAQL